MDETSKVYCEKCEERMTLMGEAYSEEVKLFRGKKPSLRAWFVIWKCPKCGGYKDIPVEKD